MAEILRFKQWLLPMHSNYQPHYWDANSSGGRRSRPVRRDRCGSSAPSQLPARGISSSSSETTAQSTAGTERQPNNVLSSCLPKAPFLDQTNRPGHLKAKGILA